MNNRIKLIIPIAVLIPLILIACDILVVPMKGRINPYDSENPVPPANSIDFDFISDDNGNWKIKIFWLDTQADYSTTIEGYVLVRNTGAAPQTIFDGTYVGRRDYGTENELYDEHHAEGYPLGRRVYYSVFSYGPKWEDMSEDDKLFTDENNNLKNYLNYNFTGPVSNYINVWASVDIQAEADDYMTNDDNWHPGSNDLRVDSSSAAPSAVACISFSLDTIPEGNIEDAAVSLNNFEAFSAGTLVYGAFEDPWDGVTTFTAGIGDASVFGAREVQVSGGAGDTQNLDVTNIVHAWYEGSRDNNGLKLTTTADPSPWFSFSSADSSNPPILRVFYWNY